jgi:hypothetical protein
LARVGVGAGGGAAGVQATINASKATAPGKK